jgi:hypothetical protein
MDGLLGTFVFQGNILGTFVFFREENREDHIDTRVVGAAIGCHTRVEVHLRHILKSFPHRRYLDSSSQKPITSSIR